MTGKEQIVEELGDLLLPNLVNQGLVANDRAKYLMTLLQTAREQADHPDGGYANLKQERLACGIQQSALDTLIQRSSREADGLYRIPHAAPVFAQLAENLNLMLAPISKAAGVPDGEREPAAEYQRRLESLAGDLPARDDELVSGESIDQITSAQPATGDSVHLLVMNLHKELNRLQRQIAAESIDGARVYGVTDADRPLIAAFMHGVNRTRKLKFDHPGLDTTATRTGDKLVIQNDIGTTDAHVLVIHVTTTQVAVTYTDVHIQRLVFFQNLLKRFDVKWEETRSRRSSKLTENLYHLCVGRFTANEPAQLADYLEFLGSRLVFLIDWNRARKRLRKLAPSAFVWMSCNGRPTTTWGTWLSSRWEASSWCSTACNSRRGRHCKSAAGSPTSQGSRG